MKNKIFFILLALVTLSFGACNDDDDDKKKENIAGTYVGTMTVTMDGKPMGDPVTNQKIYIRNASDGKVILTLKDFEFSGIPVGDIEIEADVDQNSNLVGIVQQYPIAGGVIKADITVSGPVKNNYADLLMNVQAPLFGGATVVNMVVTFQGTRI